MNEKQTTPLAIESEPVRPTKKQLELLQFIEVFITEHGYSPSYREIMHGLQYNSVATVALHVGNLIKRGHLSRRDRSARSLEVVHRTVQVTAPSLKTNLVKPGDEKWLIEKVEYFFEQAEAQASLDQATLDNLAILLAALRVLGLDGAAQSFTLRVSQLKAKAESR